MMGLSSREHHRFWIGVEDYVGNCRNKNAARASAARARSRGFSPWASDESRGQRVVCFWD
jgi:cysteinyl-tRNA synthetase